MKATQMMTKLAIVTVVLTMVAMQSHAVTLTWTGATNNEWDLTSANWSGATTVWANDDGGGNFYSASMAPSANVNIASNTDIYVEDLTMTAYRNIAGVNRSNTVLHVGGDVALNGGATGRVQFDQIQIVLEDDSAWSTQSSWDQRFFSGNSTGSMDLNGYVWTLSSGTWNLRNATFLHNGGGMDIAAGALLDHDSGNFTIGTLVYDGSPVDAGDYTSDEAWYSGSGTVTVLQSVSNGNPVPEPMTAGLAMLAMGALGLRRRRTR